MSDSDNNLRIDYIEFTVKGLSKAKSFYQSTFGWTFTDYGDQYTAFNDGRLNGGIAASADGAARGSLVVLYATDLEGAEAKVKKNGGKVVKPIFAFPGGRRFHFEDPAGNELAVWSDQ